MTEREREQRYRLEALALVAQNMPIAMLASVLNTCVIAYTLHGLVDPTLLWIWTGAQLSLSTARVVLALLCARLCVDPAQSDAWMRRMSVGIVVQAMVWSVAGGVFFRVDDALARTLISMMLAGLVAGGVAIVSPLRHAACAWVVLLVLPLATVSLQLGGPWTLFGGCCLLFMVTQLLAVVHGAERIRRIVYTDLRNQDLVASLSHTNAALERARDAAMRAADAKAQFLANMSHEIRTPMTSIIGYAGLLRETTDPDENDRYSAAIERNSQHLLGLINDVLDFSKIDAGKLEPELIDCAPAEIIASSVDMLLSSAHAKGLSLTYLLGSPFPSLIRSDPVRLKQVLVNLLSNAVKFTHDGGIEVRADLEQKDDRAILRIAVEDTGIGITAEQMEQLFTPFTQADAGITRRYGGTGLGLSISSRLAELLGGALTVASEAGHGSRFELLLELGPWDDVRTSNPRPVRTAAVPDASEGPRQFRGRVLLAEDGIDNQRLIGILLRRRGIEVELAENGLHALRAARAALAAGQPHDLILMDVHMPELDGATALRMLKSEGYPSPIVALTAQSLEGDRDGFLALGFDGYESKPIDTARLERLLARYLEPVPSAGAGS